MWTNTFETESYGRRARIFWEPLPTTAPETSQPLCCYIGTVIFYNNPLVSFEEIDRVESQWDLLGYRFSEDLEGWAGVASFVWHGEELYELSAGYVTWRNGQWYHRWLAWRVTEEDRRWPFIPKQ